MYFDRYDYFEDSFEQTYRCYPPSFIDKPNMEDGGKIILPLSALDRLVYLHTELPMLFELCNESTGRISHCGVLEFVAEEGMVFMPYWMMQNLLLQEGDFVQIKNASPPKGTYVKLQPHTKDFLDISNPKAVLERTLRTYSCLTIGDSIMVPYNNKKYYIDIVETKPNFAISIIETDCEVDFAPPLDYKEPERSQPSVPSNKSQVQDAVAESVAQKFNPFSGSARRLDGKPSAHAPGIPNIQNHGQEKAANDLKSSTASSSQSSASRKVSGKLVFGSNAGHAPAPKEAQQAPKEEPPKKEEPSFVAFTGKKYSLKN